MVSVLDSGASSLGSSPGRGHCVVPLPTQVYKWVPANCWGNLINCWGVTCDGLASCPGEVETLLAASCYRSWDKHRQLFVSLGSKASLFHLIKVVQLGILVEEEGGQRVWVGICYPLGNGLLT